MVKKEISATQLMCKAAGCLEKQARRRSTRPAPAPKTPSTYAGTPQESPFWSGAKGFGRGLWQGVSNVGRGASGLAEIVAGGIGTLGAAAAAPIEYATDRMGITNPATNASWDTAKQMGRFTGAGAKNVGDVFGAGGEKGLMGRGPNHVTKMQQEVMDAGNMGNFAQGASRVGLGFGQITASTAVPGLPAAAAGGLRGATAAAGGLQRARQVGTGAMNVARNLPGNAARGARYLPQAARYTANTARNIAGNTANVVRNTVSRIPRNIPQAANTARNIAGNTANVARTTANVARNTARRIPQAARTTADVTRRAARGAGNTARGARSTGKGAVTGTRAAVATEAAKRTGSMGRQVPEVIGKKMVSDDIKKRATLPTASNSAYGSGRTRSGRTRSAAGRMAKGAAQMMFSEQRKDMIAVNFGRKAAGLLEKQAIQPYTPPTPTPPARSTPAAPLTLAQKTRQAFPASSPWWAGVKGFAGGLLGGLKNDADIVSNAATAGVGALATGVSAIPALGEGARNLVTGRTDNVSAQTMKNLAEQTGAALSGVRSGVANVATPHLAKTDYRKEVADRMLDEGGASDSTRSWVDNSRLVGDIASNFAVGGVAGAPTTAAVAAPVRAAGNMLRLRPAAALSSLAKASPQHLVSMVRSSVPTASSAATGINAIRQGQGLRGALDTARTALRNNKTQALARAQRHPILNYPLRPVGLHKPQGMAGPLQSAWRGTGVPALGEMAKRVPGAGRLLGAAQAKIPKAVQTAFTKLRGGVPGASTPLANPVYQYPAYEAANELWRRGLDKGIVSALGESTTFTPKETYGIHLDNGATFEEAFAEITRRFAVKDTEPKDPAQIPFGYGPFNMLGGRPILDSLAGSSNFEPVPESPEEVAAYVGTLHQALDDIITPEWIQEQFTGEDGGISIQDIMNNPQYGYPDNGLPEKQQKWWQEEIIPLVKANELGKVVQDLHGVNPAQARRVKEVLDSMQDRSPK